jgi:hypothetical protein
MEQSMHINVCITVTITHVKRTEKKIGWHDDHVGYIYKFIQWGIV